METRKKVKDECDKLELLVHNPELDGDDKIRAADFCEEIFYDYLGTE